MLRLYSHFLLFVIFIFNLKASDIEQKSICDKSGNCTTQTIVRSKNAPELNMTDYVQGKCLVDPKSNASTYIDKVDVNGKNMTVLSLDSETDIVYVLKRTRLYYQDSSFNRNQFVLDCSQATAPFTNIDSLKKCIANSSESTFSLYCEKEKRF